MFKSPSALYIAVICIFLLASCSASKLNEPANTPGATISITSTGSATVTPTAKPSFTPTASATNTPAVTPGNVGLQVPEWVKNPKNNIVLVTYSTNGGGRPVKAGLINPQSGEEFIIKFKQSFHYSYWQDALHIVFLHGDYCDEPTESISEVDLSLGIVKEYETQERPDLLRDCYPNNAKEVVQLKDNSAVMVDEKSGDTIFLTDPHDSVSDVAAIVSPDKKYVAVAQVTGKYEPSELWRPEIGNQISVFRLSDRALMLQVTEDQDFTSLNFFPNSSRIMYTRGNTPCIIEISAQSSKCIEAIPRKFPGASIFPGAPTFDSRKVGFIYIHEDPYHGAFCFYDLFSGQADCPTDKFQELSKDGILNYSLSPDGKYAIFVYSNKGCPQPWCDYSGELHLAMIDIAGTAIYQLDDDTIISFTTISDWNYGLNKTWRPIRIDT
jgi:hypothetical protein